MKSSIVLLFVIFCAVSTTSTEHVRTTRDLRIIQNIIQRVLGLNQRRLIHPVIRNYYQGIRTIPGYAGKFLVRPIPQAEFNARLQAEGIYSGALIPPVPVQNNYPIAYNNYNYPPAIQGYRDRAYGYYSYGRPMYSHMNQVPIYKDTSVPLCPVTTTKLEPCHFKNRLKETNKPLVKPPKYVKNKIPEKNEATSTEQPNEENKTTVKPCLELQPTDPMEEHLSQSKEEQTSTSNTNEIADQINPSVLNDLLNTEKTTQKTETAKSQEDMPAPFVDESTDSIHPFTVVEMEEIEITTQHAHPPASDEDITLRPFVNKGTDQNNSTVDEVEQTKNTTQPTTTAIINEEITKTQFINKDAGQNNSSTFYEAEQTETTTQLTVTVKTEEENTSSPFINESINRINPLTLDVAELSENTAYTSKTIKPKQEDASTPFVNESTDRINALMVDLADQNENTAYTSKTIQPKEEDSSVPFINDSADRINILSGKITDQSDNTSNKTETIKPTESHSATLFVNESTERDNLNTVNVADQSDITTIETETAKKEDSSTDQSENNTGNIKPKEDTSTPFINEIIDDTLTEDIVDSTENTTYETKTTELKEEFIPTPFNESTIQINSVTVDKADQSENTTNEPATTEQKEEVVSTSFIHESTDEINPLTLDISGHGEKTANETKTSEMNEEGVSTPLVNGNTDSINPLTLDIANQSENTINKTETTEPKEDNLLTSFANGNIDRLDVGDQSKNTTYEITTIGNLENLSAPFVNAIIDLNNSSMEDVVGQTDNILEIRETVKPEDEDALTVSGDDSLDDIIVPSTEDVVDQTEKTIELRETIKPTEENALTPYVDDSIIINSSMNEAHQNEHTTDIIKDKISISTEDMDQNENTTETTKANKSEEEASFKPFVNGNMDQANNPAQTFETDKLNPETAQLYTNDIKTSISDVYSAVPSEKRPIYVLKAPFTNTEYRNIEGRIKMLPVSESSRGDIPDVYLQ